MLIMLMMKTIVDIIKDFFKQMNNNSPVRDHKDRMYFVDCQSDENNPFLEFI